LGLLGTSGITMRKVTGEMLNKIKMTQIYSKIPFISQSIAKKHP